MYSIVLLQISRNVPMFAPRWDGFLCQMDKVYSNLILHFFAMLHRKSHTVNLEMFPVVSGFLI